MKTSDLRAALLMVAGIVWSYVAFVWLWPWLAGR